MVVTEVSYIWLERGADASTYKKDKSGYSVFKLTLRRLPAQTATERNLSFPPVLPSTRSTILLPPMPLPHCRNEDSHHPHRCIFLKIWRRLTRQFFYRSTQFRVFRIVIVMMQTLDSVSQATCIS